MPLDLSKIAPQIDEMISRLKAAREEKQEHLHSALEIFKKQSADPEAFARKIAASHTTWLVAGLTGKFDESINASSTPRDFTVAATDGSQIDFDRHRAARCFLLNFGTVELHYGNKPDAYLESFPVLYSDVNALAIRPPDGKGREESIIGPLLAIKRSAEELSYLTQRVSHLKIGGPSLALLDGSLILWSLAAYPDFVAEEILGKSYLLCLDMLEKAGMPLASYISFTGANDVVNALRVAVCPHLPADCDKYCEGKDNKPCDFLADVRDSEIFTSILKPGERSSIFTSQSSIVRKCYGRHQIAFYYLRLNEEVARVEIPWWVVQNKGQLDLTHTLILDQCRRGQGYPVVLSEAHEQAVVTNADKEQFWELVQSAMFDKKIAANSSAKSLSKRTRWV